MSGIQPDEPEADVQEQKREWTESKDDDHTEIPMDAPEADVLEQERSADLEEDDHGHD